MYEYNCKIVRIIDGDTVDVEVDLGWNTIVRGRTLLSQEREIKRRRRMAYWQKRAYRNTSK